MFVAADANGTTETSMSVSIHCDNDACKSLQELGAIGVADLQLNQLQHNVRAECANFVVMDMRNSKPV